MLWFISSDLNENHLLIKWSLVIFSTLMHFHYSVIINYSWFVIKSKSFLSFLNVKIKSFIIKQIHISENIKNVPPCKNLGYKEVSWSSSCCIKSEIKSYLLAFISSWDNSRLSKTTTTNCTKFVHCCTAGSSSGQRMSTNWIWRAWSLYSGAALQSHWLTDPNFQNSHLTQRQSSSRSPSSWSPSSLSSTSSRMSSTQSEPTPFSCRR